MIRYQCVIEDCDRLPVLHIVTGLSPIIDDTKGGVNHYGGTSCCSWEHLREYAAMREEHA